MTSLGIAYVVIASLAFMAAVVHFAQALVLRKDPTPFTVACSCLGFALYATGVATTRGIPDSGEPLAGLVTLGLGFTLICAFVPMTAWTLLELPLTRRRLALVLVLVAIGLGRTVDICVAGTSYPPQTWLSIPAGLAAIAVSVVWTVESFRSRSTPYAPAMVAFGAVGVAVTLPGFVIDIAFLPGIDLIGFAGAPFIAFVNTFSMLRYVHALKNPDQPAGDINRYQVLEQLGSGGMGDVFLARRRGPAGFVRDVVLKTLREAETSPEAHQRFLAEARLAAQLRHPNIVDVYDLGEQPGGFFIVMERIEGPTLGQVVQQARDLSSRIPVEIAAELGVQLCRALDFAHAAGVVHRDLKPQNVMLSRGGQAKLIDFGIAQQQKTPGTAALTEGANAPGITDGVVGTPGYISPERLFGEAAAPASDLFAMGVLLYQVLSLEYPFPQRSPVQLIAAVRDGQLTPLQEKRPDCPKGLASAIERCLAFDAGHRPRSAAALGAELEAALGGTRVDLAAYVTEMFPSGLPAAPVRQAATPHDATTATAPARIRGA